MNFCSSSGAGDFELEGLVFSLTLLTKPDNLFLNAEVMAVVGGFRFCNHRRIYAVLSR